MSYHCLFFRLRALLFFFGVVLAIPHQVRAQTHGYGFAGVTLGDNDLGGAFRYGIGAGWAVIRHVTVGGEFGGMSEDGIIASVNVGLHVRRRIDSGPDPFISGGITGVRLQGETGGYGNMGGGLNYWLHPRIGLRAEFRGYLGGQDLVNFSEIRFGISFR